MATLIRTGTPTVVSITYILYNNTSLLSIREGDAKKIVLPMPGVSKEHALGLKATLATMPCVGGVINVNLSNGNHL